MSETQQQRRIGIDVGGTNTDAVLIDDAGAVLASIKVATTVDPLDGIREALRGVLDGQDASLVSRAMLGTTHPANAIIQRKGLDKVGVLRLALPSSTAVNVGAAWPQDIRDVVLGPTAIIEGGHEYTGAEISPLDEEAVRRLANEAVAAGCSAIAVSGAFSPASPEHELRSAEIIQEEVGDALNISLSHQVGALGLLERENATILNASLLTVSHAVVFGFQAALADNSLDVRAYLTQNDGTLMTAKQAQKNPVLTLASGPTNSMRGACALAGVNNAIVIDVGGTSADAGILVDGFPRESTAAVEVGGVRTNFRMPDLISIGLGGGTIVRNDSSGLRIGPDSVGYAVSTEALCVGGSTLTLSDISLAAGRLEGFGDPTLVSSLDADLVAGSTGWVDEQISILADRMKSSRDAVPLLAVGGGAHLVPDSLDGVSEVVRPPHHGVANAYGACISEASGSIDKVYSYDVDGREACVDDARAAAVELAIQSGADPEQTRITSVSEIPMTYVPGGGCRVLVKAVGPLR
ncbi:MAG: N-methylhydantoinase A/oxoprolinase/acetone carboxylase beta subunit [Verrucomicrobiales bacterium]